MPEFDIASPKTPRWIQRFAHFDRALLLLRTAVELLDERDRNLDPELLAIVREGAIQRFEYCFELAWKTLKDYLQWRKVTLPKTGGGDVLRTAFETGYITEGDIWLEALDARNEMSHVYRQESFERVLNDVRSRFLDRLEDLHEMLMMARMAWWEEQRGDAEPT